MSADPTTLHDVILQTWKSAFGEQNVTYLSGPITTGPRFLKWHSETNDGKLENSATKHDAVIVPNSNDLVEAAREIRLYWPQPVVEPASFFISEWTQKEYLKLWSEFIATHTDTIIFMQSWESSVGCITEFCRAISHDKRTVTRDGRPISLEEAVEQVSKNLSRIEALEPQPQEYLERFRGVLAELEGLAKPKIDIICQNLDKDESLDVLADQINVAQFVAFRPAEGKIDQSYSRIKEESPNSVLGNPREAITMLLQRSFASSINVRSYAPGDSQSKPFEYGLNSVDEALGYVEKYNGEGLRTIVNETIDVKDGGVSGVLWDDIIEFGPDDTPRIVEKPDVCSLNSGMGIRLLEAVYGFAPDFHLPRNGRLEFSIHPYPVGWRQRHTVGWEFSASHSPDILPKLAWPNRFSRLIGDKAFGLLVAHELGLNVPKTNVISRRVAPFTFGRSTGTSEFWIRTAPTVQNPGQYTTNRGWVDPYTLLKDEDPNGTDISSVLAQVGVHPKFSGASIVLSDGTVHIEGVEGVGDGFMLGKIAPGELPKHVANEIEKVHQTCSELGPVRFEWVYDGKQLWVVQLHCGITASSSTVIVEGQVSSYQKFDPQFGLSELKKQIASLPEGVGIELIRNVGLTSHFADVLRRIRLPSRIASSNI